MQSPNLDLSCDVVVVGAGPAGLAAALGLRRAGLNAVCVGRLESDGFGRTVALLGRSLDGLDDLGVRAEVEAAGAPLRTLRIVDDTGSLFAPPPVEFRAAEIGSGAFGYNIENGRLASILDRAFGDRIEAEAVGYAFGGDDARLTLSDGRTLAAKLVVGADGRGSPSRKAAGIDMTSRRLGQTALTLRLSHTRPHGDVSTEFHTRQGPFTLVPLPPSADAAHRSSLVWMMRDAEAARRRGLTNVALAEEVRAHAHAMLGDMTIEGERGAFAMTVQRVARLTAPRLALIGDAAHAFPPIGAQGLNLGLRDAAAIVVEAARARDRGDDVGGPAALARYAVARRADIAARTFGVGLLNTALLNPSLDLPRGLGLAALGALGPLRRLAMREGLSPSLAR